VIARGLLLGLFVLTLFLLEAVVGPAVAVLGVPPDLATMAVVGVALMEGPGSGARFGFVVGFFRDLLGAAGGLMGPWMLALLLVGYLAGVARSYLDGAELRTHLWVGAAAAALAWTIAGSLSLLLASGAVAPTSMLLRTTVAAGWGAILGPAVCRLTQALVARVTVAPSV
jgi:rod shape-determining protein MreD